MQHGLAARDGKAAEARSVRVGLLELGDYIALMGEEILVPVLIGIEAK